MAVQSLAWSIAQMNKIGFVGWCRETQRGRSIQCQTQRRLFCHWKNTNLAAGWASDSLCQPLHCSLPPLAQLLWSPRTDATYAQSSVSVNALYLDRDYLRYYLINEQSKTLLQQARKKRRFILCFIKLPKPPFSAMVTEPRTTPTLLFLPESDFREASTETHCLEFRTTNHLLLQSGKAWVSVQEIF